MSDAYTLVKCRDESMKEFNERIGAACDDNHVTDAQIDIVDGQPVVTLLWSDPEDLGTEAEDEAGQDPLRVLVAQVSAVSEEASARSEKFMGALFELADANIVDVQFAVGPALEWITATDLVEITNPAYRFAEVVRHNQGFGSEFNDGADAKEFRPIAGKKSDPQASYDAAAFRLDTAMVRYNASYALVAYLVAGDDEADENSDDPNTEEAAADVPVEETVEA